MTIYNKSSIPIEVSGKVINPRDSNSFNEQLFDSRAINSANGYSIIYTQNGQRNIKNHGHIEAVEGEFETIDGFTDIYVYDAN